MIRFLLFIVIVTWLGCFTLAHGQIQHGIVQGTISDPARASIAKAEVKLANPLTGQHYQVVSNPNGAFIFHNVPFAAYTLQIEASGFAPYTQPLVVRSNVPLTIAIQLQVAGTIVTLAVKAAEPLVEADNASSSVNLAQDFLQRAPRTNRNRMLQETVATAPGTATENNGLVHLRGIDDGILYVIDGIPIVDRLDAVSASPIDTDTINAVQIITGNIPAEFGGRNGAVVIVQPKSGIDSPLTGNVQMGAANFKTAELVAGLGGKISKNFGFYLNGATHRSNRFLDPVALENFHNSGGGVNLSVRTDWHWSNKDILLFNAATNGANFNVSNDAEQEQAGQRQQQKLRDYSQSLSWQRLWNARTVTNLAYFHRTHEVILQSNEKALPLFAEQDREHTRHGLLASLTTQQKNHTIKTGIEFQRIAPREYFKFFVTDEEAAEDREISDHVIAFDDDDPFIFRDAVRRNYFAAYWQDSFAPRKNISLQFGVRYDHSNLLIADQQISPRLGAVFFIPQSKTAIRASFNRLYQPPQVDNLLLAASEAARQLSPFATASGGGNAEIRPEKVSAYEIGFAQNVAGLFKLDAAYWWRNFRNVGDPNVFFNTTIIFPNSVNKGWSRGVDVRLDVPERKGFSGYVSYTNMRVLQTGPINGGLFLTDEFIEIGAGTKFIPDQDQRNTGSFALNYQQPQSGLLLSFFGRHESGVPLEVEAERLEELKSATGAELVNFQRGRVKPRTIFNFTAGINLFKSENVTSALQFDVLNIFDKAFAYNFGNPFEGTHFGSPRRWSGNLRFSFR